jgi:hypothetical protein
LGGGYGNYSKRWKLIILEFFLLEIIFVLIRKNVNKMYIGKM